MIVQKPRYFSARGGVSRFITLIKMQPHFTYGPGPNGVPKEGSSLTINRAILGISDLLQCKYFTATTIDSNRHSSIIYLSFFPLMQLKKTEIETLVACIRDRVGLAGK